MGSHSFFSGIWKKGGYTMKNRCLIVLFTIAFVSTCFGQTADKTKAKKPYDDLGKLSSNKYDPDSVSNPYGRFGNPYGNTIKNPYSQYGSPFSSKSANNPYASGSNSPILVGEDGKYLGRLNSNKHDPQSVSNPYGRYGSPYSPDSVNNPYGKYGSPYSPNSATNPYAIQTPKIFAPTTPTTTLPKKSNDFLKWPDKR